MSHVTFTTRNGDRAEVPSGERAYAMSLSAAINMAILDVKRNESGPRWLRDMCDPPPGRDLAHWMDGGESRCKASFVLPDKRKILAYHVFLNTLIKMGSDPLRFLARFEGTCELHGWVAGWNRYWLADVVDNGRKSNILRSEMGWEDVTKLLRSGDAHPVVMSFSASEPFPNQLLASFSPFSSSWEQDSFHDQFGLAFAGLTRNKENSDLEITPENLGTAFFGEDDGFSAFDLNALRAEHFTAEMEKLRK